MKGRKPTQESRAAEFRRRLIAWKQTPESSAAIAEGAGSRTRHFAPTAKALPRWIGEVAIQGALPQGTEESDQILARAIVEGRPMTQWEENDATLVP